MNIDLSKCEKFTLTTRIITYSCGREVVLFPEIDDKTTPDLVCSDCSSPIHSDITITEEL